MKVAIITSLLILSPLMAFGQPDQPGGQGGPHRFDAQHLIDHRIDHLKTVGITAEQETQIRNLYQTEVTQVRQLHESTEKQVRAILTPEQREKLKAERQERREKGNDGNNAMPPPPPPAPGQ